MSRLRVLLAMLLLMAADAGAHDSWLVAAGGGFTIATGNRYPLADTSAPVPVQCAEPVLSCWVQLVDHEIELAPDKIKLYLNEIQAAPTVRSTWAQWQADGLPWRERYSKFARIELASAASASPQQRVHSRRPVGAGLEIVVLGTEPIAIASALSFQVLRDGKPLADFAVELVSERNPLGIWRRTNTQGRLQHTLPFGGHWLLRGVDLRVSQEHIGQWESRFVTLAFEAP